MMFFIRSRRERQAQDRHATPEDPGERPDRSGDGTVPTANHTATHPTGTRSAILLRRTNHVGRAVFWALVFSLVALATWANLDMTEARPFLHMDEAIAFDGVKRILAAPSPDRFWWAVTDGGDQRYGRIFYNASALIAYLPYRLWGDSGLIVAVRCAQVAFMVGAYVLLCFTFVRSWPFRALTFAAFACLPFTDYYLSQPKPEPIQLLFLATFLASAKPRDFAFGFHWIFLGLAFGAKISAAPFCAVAGGLGFLQQILRPRTWIAFAGQLGRAGGTFLLGWLAAVPILFFPTSQHIDDYLNWTFRSTSHGSDDATVNGFVWLKALLGGPAVKGYISPTHAVILATGIVVVLVAALASETPARSPRDRLLKDHLHWVTLTFSLSLLVPIVLVVKRIWGLYLHSGEILMIVALVGLSENLLTLPTPTRLAHAGRIAAVGGFIGALVLACGVSANSVFREYRRLAHRTEDPAFRTHLAAYRSIVASLEELTSAYTRAVGVPTLTVAYDPFLFLPESRSNMTVQVFWEPSSVWDITPPAIVLGRQYKLAYFLGEAPLPPSTAANYEQLRRATELFRANVEVDPEAESPKPYRLVKWYGDWAALVLRRDVAEIWRQAHEPAGIGTFER